MHSDNEQSGGGVAVPVGVQEDSNWGVHTKPSKDFCVITIFLNINIYQHALFNGK